MTIYGADGKTLVDVHALPIEERDLLILRSDRDVGLEDFEELQSTVLASNPEWRGGLIVMRTDESIEKLDKKALLNLYEMLKAMFESWETYVKQWESDKSHCVRCGQELPAQEASEENHVHSDACEHQESSANS